jgi:hypothetical protein
VNIDSRLKRVERDEKPIFTPTPFLEQDKWGGSNADRHQETGGAAREKLPEKTLEKAERGQLVRIGDDRVPVLGGTLKKEEKCETVLPFQQDHPFSWAEPRRASGNCHQFTASG